MDRRRRTLARKLSYRSLREQNQSNCVRKNEVNESQSSSKRTKKSETNAFSSRGSDAHTNYAINIEQDEKDDEFDILEPVRPVGRVTTKRATSSSCQTVCSIPKPTNSLINLKRLRNFNEKNTIRKNIQEKKKSRVEDYPSRPQSDRMQIIEN
ncbi:hypothetical protein R6Q59_024167 [Mikania micrantha]